MPKAKDYSATRLTPGKSCRLRRSTQHFVEIYLQESGNLKSFSVAINAKVDRLLIDLKNRRLLLA
jgi:hypothetical protein